MPTFIKNWFSGLSGNVIFLSLTSLFGDISTEMLYPVLPVYLTQTLKASGGVLGLIEGMAQATQNIAQGFSGYLSDKWQKRKPVALAGYILAAVAKPFLGIAGSWQLVLGARVADRLGAGTRSAPRDALIAASVEEKYRGKAFGMESLGDNLGAFLGPVITVLLFFSLRLDIQAIFYLAFIPGMIAALLVLFVKEAKVKVEDKSKIDMRIRQFPRPYWKYLFVTALFGIGNSSNSFLILQLKGKGLSLTATVLIYAVFNLIAAMISYPAGSLSDRLGRKPVLLAAFIVFFCFVCRLCFCPGYLVNRGSLCFLRSVPGNFPVGGQVPCHRSCPQSITGERHRLVFHYSRGIRSYCQHSSGAALGQGRPYGCICIWRPCISHRDHSLIDNQHRPASGMKYRPTKASR